MTGNIEAFREVVREHYANPRDTLTVERVADKLYHVVGAGGVVVRTTSLRRDADHHAGPDGWYFWFWRDRERWYSGQRNAHERALTDAERAVIREVRAEFGVS